MHRQPAVGVEQAAGQLGQVQEPGRRPPDDVATIVGDHAAWIELHLESGRRDRDIGIDRDVDLRSVRIATFVFALVLPTSGDHLSIPFESGSHRPTASASRTAMSLSIRLPSAAEAAIGSPSIPLSLTAATPPARIDAINSDTGVTLPLTISSTRTAIGEMCSNSDVSV